MRDADPAAYLEVGPTRTRRRLYMVPQLLPVAEMTSCYIKNYILPLTSGGTHSKQASNLHDLAKKRNYDK